MIWLWLTFSSLLVPAAPAAIGRATVTGTVELVESRNPQVRKNKDFSGVVVWLEPADASLRLAPNGIHKRAEMVQRNKKFIPHVLAVPVGAAVDFPNFDPIFHNAFSNFNGQVFDIGLYAPGSSRTVRFNRPGIVRVFCNIHPTMSAIIAVLNTPYFAVTNHAGEFAMPGVAPGEYQLHYVHERAQPQVLDALSRKLQVTGDDLSLGTARISESGYLEAPHKNKYGKDYPPPPDDRSVYPDSAR
jgi:plastocyanin